MNEATTTNGIPINNLTSLSACGELLFQTGHAEVLNTIAGRQARTLRQVADRRINEGDEVSAAAVFAVADVLDIFVQWPDAR